MSSPSQSYVDDITKSQLTLIGDLLERNVSRVCAIRQARTVTQGCRQRRMGLAVRRIAAGSAWLAQLIHQQLRRRRQRGALANAQHQLTPRARLGQRGSASPRLRRYHCALWRRITPALHVVGLPGGVCARLVRFALPDKLRTRDRL